MVLFNLIYTQYYINYNHLITKAFKNNVKDRPIQDIVDIVMTRRPDKWGMLDGSLFISIFCFIKNFYKIFCTFLPVKKYYSTCICLKQAIQPRVVGPLFI